VTQGPLPIPLIRKISFASRESGPSRGGGGDAPWSWGSPCLLPSAGRCAGWLQLVGSGLRQPGAPGSALHHASAQLPAAGNQALQVPAAGLLYHGVLPQGTTEPDSDVSPASLDAYVRTVGRKVAYVYFSTDCFRSRGIFRPAPRAGARSAGRSHSSA